MHFCLFNISVLNLTYNINYYDNASISYQILLNKNYDDNIEKIWQ